MKGERGERGSVWRGEQIRNCVSTKLSHCFWYQAHLPSKSKKVKEIAISCRRKVPGDLLSAFRGVSGGHTIEETVSTGTISG